ncbi:hypothetical protein Hanom_Chr03g00208411 [Helianthus anomalus]
MYSKSIAHGRHIGLVASFNVAARGEAIENLLAFKLDFPSRVLVTSPSKRALFETGDEEGGDAGPSSIKLKISDELEKVSSMSIPIDVTLLSFANVETTPLVVEDEGSDGLDDLYDALPGSSTVPRCEVVVDEVVGGSGSI